MRRVWLFLLLGLLLWPVTAHADGPGEEQPRRARVFFSNGVGLNRLAGQLDVWEVHRDEGYLVTWLTPAQAAVWEAAGWRVVLDPPQEPQLFLPRLMLSGQQQGIPGFACYRTVEETYQDLAALAEEHPSLARWVDIGDSWEKVTSGGVKGYDLNALVLTNQERPGPKPVFLLIAAIHAREYATAELATRFATYLVDAYGQDPDVTWLLDRFEIHIIPQANPDGRKRAEAGVLWRKNTDNDDGCTAEHVDWGSYFGTDLNRNSSFKWGGHGASASPCSEVYRGPSPASEPEVQAIESYARTLFPDQRGPADTDPASPQATGMFITLHSYGQYVLYPWNWTDASHSPNDAELKALARKFAFFNHYWACDDCLYDAAGTTDDFMYGELGVASFTFELGTTFFQDCATFEREIVPRNIPALLYAFKSAYQPYQTASGPDVVEVSVVPSAVQGGQRITVTAVADDTRYWVPYGSEQPVQAIARMGYTWDALPWETTRHPMSPVDGVWDASVEQGRAVVETTGMAPGRHLLLVQAQDAEGRWGPPTAVFVDIQAGSDFPDVSGVGTRLVWMD